MTRPHDRSLQRPRKGAPLKAASRVVKAPANDQLPAISRLLETCGLPTDDLATQDWSDFRVLVEGELLVAVGGLERFGRVALLRSVATQPDARRRGVGSAIVHELEGLAKGQGVEDLYLLTESAEEYFGCLGYARCERRSAPPSIAATRQFATLCPDTATFMHKRLVP